MSLKNETVLQAHEALVNLLKSDKEAQYNIPKNVRLLLAENLNKTIDILKPFEQQHNALVAKNGVKDPKTGQYQIVPGTDGHKVFEIEKQGLLNSESGVEAFETFSYNDLPEGVPIDLIALLLKTGLMTT